MALSRRAGEAASADFPAAAVPNLDAPPAIRCRGIVKEFGRGETLIRVLQGIDLDVRENEMTFIVGPSCRFAYLCVREPKLLDFLPLRGVGDGG